MDLLNVKLSDELAREMMQTPDIAIAKMLLARVVLFCMQQNVNPLALTEGFRWILHNPQMKEETIVLWGEAGKQFPI